MNRPYVKQYDSKGDLINPIDGFYESKTVRPEFPNGFPNRRERRKALIQKDRAFSNKKGIQLVVTYIGMGKFMKHYKQVQNINGKQITHYVEHNA